MSGGDQSIKKERNEASFFSKAVDTIIKTTQKSPDNVDSDASVLKLPLEASLNAVSQPSSPLGLSQFPDDFDFKYKMDHKKRGKFVIFNQMNFEKYQNLEVRLGTDVDVTALDRVARSLGFEVELHNNLIRKHMKHKIWEYADMDHRENDCFVCVILTHGGQNDELYSYDDEMNLKDFTEPFKANSCESLAGKPKLFFIQACRGEKLDSGKRMLLKGIGPGRIDKIPKKELPKTYTIPVQADFLVAQATAPEYYAWRNPDMGAIFIQSLCSVLETYGSEWEIFKILTRVNCMVAYNYASNCGDKNMNNKKQIPSFTSQLTKELYFPKSKT